MEAAELYTHTHTHTHTQLRRCLAFLFSAFSFISSAFSATLPSGYTRLEYIESSGTQYIDTGIYADKNTEIELVVKTNGPGPQYMFGISGTNAMLYRVSQVYLNNNLSFNFGPDVINSSVVGYDDFHKIVVKDQSFYVDDELIGSFETVNNFTQTNTAYLFDAQDAAWSDTGSKIKYLKIWQSGTLVRDYIPTINPNGVVGMYDVVSGNFFANADTRYTQLEYLKSTGTQYIEDTSFQTINTGAIEIKTKDLQTHARFAGWGSDNYLYTAVALATPNDVINYFPFNYANSWDDNNPNPVNIVNENKIRFEFKPGLQKLYVNDVFNRQAQKTGTISSYPFRMFKVSLNTSVLNGSSTIYYCKVFNGVEALTRHYIPVRRDSDGSLGMYETTTRAFLQNIGTGNFIAGSDMDTFLNDFIAGPVFDTCTYTMMLGTSVCLSETKPTGSYLPIRYNNNKYYLNLSVESDETNPKPITSESNNALRIITNTATYNAHDASVSE